MFYTAM